MPYPLGQDEHVVAPLVVVYVAPEHTAQADAEVLPVLLFAVPAPHSVRPPDVERPDTEPP